MPPCAYAWINSISIDMVTIKMGLHHVASFSSVGVPPGAGGVDESGSWLGLVIDGAGGLSALQDGENFKVG